MKWFINVTPRVSVLAIASFHNFRLSSWRSIRVIALFGILFAVLAVASPARGSIPTAAAVSFQPELPIAASFFYPWYPSHWTENEIFPFTNYTPSLGFYSSMDDAVIAEQLALAEQAHLEAFISSWWGQGNESDIALQQSLTVTEEIGSSVRWAAYYEPEGYSDPNVGQIVGDLQYLDEHAFNSPAYLRVDGEPVIFVYGLGPEGCSMVDRWVFGEAYSGIDVYVVLKVFDGYGECSSQPDSWHQYNPTVAFNQALPDSVSVSPGFWKSGEGVALERNAANFEYALQWMVATDAPWQLVSTWNEWLEGTTVEPSEEYGETYIDILCRTLPGTAPCSSDSGAPTPVPTDTQTPTPTPSATTDPAPTTVPAVPTVTPIPTSSPGSNPSPSAAPTPGPAPPNTAFSHGNVDCDSDVDSADALKVLRSLAFTPSVGSAKCPTIASEVGDYVVGDVDCDGTVDPIDGLMILRFVVGLHVVQEPFCPAIASSV